MGLVGCPWAICDEPGAWEVNGGTLLHDAIETAKGKPGSPRFGRCISGRSRPARGGWWHDMVDDGTHGSDLRASAPRRSEAVGPMAGDTALQSPDRE